MRLAILLSLILGCAAADSEPNPLDRLPIDEARAGSLDDAAGWSYRKSVSADLDGDGTTEAITLASDVTVRPATGQPIWEEGHRWAVFVDDRGTRTLLYGAFVPHGFVECAIGIEGSDGSRAVIVQERSPRHLRVMDIAYRGRDSARLQSDAHYPLEQWLPDSATLR